MPLLVFIYFTQFLDKNILSYASVMNFPVTGIWYNDVAQAFYMGFLIWMFPTQYIGQKFPIAKYLGISIIAWGTVLACHALAHNFTGLIVLRTLLGIFEAGIGESSPGMHGKTASNG